VSAKAVGELLIGYSLLLENGRERIQHARSPARLTMQSAERISFLVRTVCVFALGFREPPALKTVLWTTSLGFMGVMCLLNAFRCGRVHCLFTGPFFILSALATVGYWFGLLPFGPSGWKWIGTVTIIGAIALYCIPEFILGRYRRKTDTASMG